MIELKFFIYVFLSVYIIVFIVAAIKMLQNMKPRGYQPKGVKFDPVIPKETSGVNLYSDKLKIRVLGQALRLTLKHLDKKSNLTDEDFREIIIRVLKNCNEECINKKEN